jgi:hypothetical protein
MPSVGAGSEGTNPGPGAVGEDSRLSAGSKLTGTGICTGALFIIILLLSRCKVHKSGPGEGCIVDCEELGGDLANEKIFSSKMTSREI